MLQILVKARRVLGLDKLFKALKNRNMPVGEAHIFWLLQERPQYKVLSCGSSDGVQVW